MLPQPTPDLIGTLTPPQLRLEPDSPYDRRGFYRSPITYASYRVGHPNVNKGKRFPPEPLTQREVLALVAACGKGRAGLRNRAMIVVMWRAGLRVAELLALEPKDVDLDAGLIRVLHGKGDRARTVGLDPAACAVVEKWMTVRKQIGATRGQKLFCIITEPTIGEPVHSAYVRNMMKMAAARAGIEKRVHPHGLRHTHATELADEGIDLRIVRRQLGHSNLSITARYIEHLNPSEVVEAIRGRQWAVPPVAAATAPAAIPLD